jgi:hypothetical protein
VVVLDLAKQQITQHQMNAAVALGYAPDGRLWRLS